MVANFDEAESVIVKWQRELHPTSTLILLDQPTIVPNPSGQRPVENIVGSPVSLRYGGMQPANTAKTDMFGEKAPVWGFLKRFGGPSNPMEAMLGTRVFETYPVLTILAFGWTLPDSRAAGRLPKYNPARERTFSTADWKHLCERTAGAFRGRGLMGIARWIDDSAQKTPPRKRDQDGLDACLCLLVALQLAEHKQCLMVGDLRTGHMVVPYHDRLDAELVARCKKTGRVPAEWVRAFQLRAGTP